MVFGMFVYGFVGFDAFAVYGCLAIWRCSWYDFVSVVVLFGFTV
jgi:hypothetical protein